MEMEMERVREIERERERERSREREREQFLNAAEGHDMADADTCNVVGTALSASATTRRTWWQRTGEHRRENLLPSL
jgi:hypothetical protein